jgi:hypothetical protein
MAPRGRIDPDYFASLRIREGCPEGSRRLSRLHEMQKEDVVDDLERG